MRLRALSGRGVAWLLLSMACGGAAAARPVGEQGVVRFVYPDSTAKSVYLSGDFNGWSPTATPMDREVGQWTTRVFLDPGVYEYKLLVDASWHTDPDNPELSPQGNSVVRIGPNGEVLPPQSPGAAVGGEATSGAGEGRELRGSLRYIGLLNSRQDRALGRYDLDAPLHQVDARLDAVFTPEVSGWFLAKLDSVRDASDLSRAAVRYDRGLLQWNHQPYLLRLFDQVGVGDFDDPAVLVGRIGIYGDAFGYRRRGADVTRTVLGAPLRFVYADDTEREANRPPDSALPPLHLASPAALAGHDVRRYVTSRSHRNSDVLALRASGGPVALGVGASFRLDRGRAAGRLAELHVRASGDTLLAAGRELETSESWSAWGLDARLQLRGAGLAVEYLSGTAQVRSARETPVLELRAAPGASSTQSRLGEPHGTSARFDLDHSRRVLLRLQPARDEAGNEPPASRDASYEFEEHDYSALVTGTPFRMRRHTAGLRGEGRRLGITASLDLEQHWFRYPPAASWETQFWFRRFNGWLDADTAQFERLALLGLERAAVGHLDASRLLWPRRGVRGELRLAYATPDLGSAPRFLENVLRLVLPLGTRLDLRTHSRFATYRRFETTESRIVAALGPGPHLEAGAIDLRGLQGVRHDYRNFASHFVELLYTASSKVDLSLGFGVRPFVLYPVTNEFADVGWDFFLFEQGASPADAFADPGRLATRLERAERALERERRVSIQARVHF